MSSIYKDVPLRRVKIRNVNLVSLVLDATQTLWTPKEGELMVLDRVFIKLVSSVGTVTTRPQIVLQSNSVNVSGLVQLPLVVNNSSLVQLVSGGSNASVTVTSATPGVVTWVNHNIKNYDPVTFTAATIPTGLTAGTVYYATVVTADTFKVSTSLANAIAGTFVATSSTGTTVVANTGAFGSQFNNDNPLKLKVALAQVGATTLLYDVVLFGLPLHDL